MKLIDLIVYILGAGLFGNFFIMTYTLWVGAFSNWQVTIFMNSFGEGMFELIFMSVFSILYLAGIGIYVHDWVRGKMKCDFTKCNQPAVKKVKLGKIEMNYCKQHTKEVSGTLNNNFKYKKKK